MHEISYNTYQDLKDLIASKQYSQLVVIVDEHTAVDCLPRFREEMSRDMTVIQIVSGEEHKTIETCQQIWDQMQVARIDRHSLSIQLGGGVIGDMGGFCAATYMRGIDFVQVPTTLLAQVDASVGGKLGIDYNGHKNHIGIIRNPELVIIDPAYIDTLPDRQVVSGYAEILKHGLIADRHYWERCSKQNPKESGIQWLPIVERSIDIKSAIVKQDPLEKGIRKALNYGHTVGHAIETMHLGTDSMLLHGEAIAIGMVVEAHLSFQHGLLDLNGLTVIEQSILAIYGHTSNLVRDIDGIYDLMLSDKKNRGGEIRCTLLDGIGRCKIDQAVTKEQVQKALQYYEAH